MAKKIYNSKINELKSKLTLDTRKDIEEMCQKKYTDLKEYLKKENIKGINVGIFMKNFEYELVKRFLRNEN